MCFEFEWLYWAQMAQEEEQRRKDAAKRFDAKEPSRVSKAGQAPGADPQALDQRKPLHA